MAGDWIPIRIDLHEDPAVMSMASDLGVREETVVGHLIRIWGWVSRQCNADTVTNVTLNALGRVTDSQGYPELMVKYGWLTTGQNDDGIPFIRIEKFDRWLSKTAKVRASTRLRVKKHRDDVTQVYGKCNGESVTNVTKMYGKCNANVTPTEENRTEEKKEITPYSPPLGDGGKTFSGKTRKRKGPRNHERTYTPEFLAGWAEWRPYDSPKGDKSQAADVIEAFDDETHRQYRQAARAYCDECHRLRCKTKHVSTFARGDWRQYLVDEPIQAAVTTKEQTELADAERKRRGELFRSWESACVLADGAGQPRPPKPEELTRPPVHYRLGGVLTNANKKATVRSGEPVQLRYSAS